MNFSIAKRPSTLRLAWQITVDNFYRLRIPLITLTWLCLIVAVAAISMTYYEAKNESVWNANAWRSAVQKISPIITPVTFYVAIVIATWGCWTREGNTGFPSRYFLLPVSSGMLTLLALASQVVLCLLAIIAGILPAAIVGIDYQLEHSLPLFAGAFVLALMTNWCRTDVRFLAYLGLLVVGAVYFFKAEDYLGANLSVRWMASVWGLVGLILVGVVVIDAQRKGAYFGLKRLTKLFQQWIPGEANESRNRPAARIQKHYHASSKSSMLLAYDLRRLLVPIGMLVCSGNFAAFVFLLWFGFGNVGTTLCLVFSVTCILFGSLTHGIRARSMDQQIRSHLGVLPVTDTRLGTTWIFNLLAVYASCVLIFVCSLGPALLYLLTKPNYQLGWDSVIAVRLVYVPFLIISLIYTLFAVGRSLVIVILFFLVLAFFMVASVSATWELLWLMDWNVMAASVGLLATYVLVCIVSIRTNTFVWWLHLANLLVCIWQLAWEIDFLTGFPLVDTKFYGLILLPGLAFVCAPLAAHLNRHR